MRKSLLLFIICFLPFTNLAQNSNVVPEQNISTDNEVIYRLFPTKNMYTFIKLDTRNGNMWQVQWNTDQEKRFVSRIY